jgi:hypothetical protein
MATPQATTDALELDRVTCDAERYVERAREEWWISDGLDPETVTYEPDEETYQGAIMYAARIIRRRNAPSGMEIAIDGNPVFVSRYDADIDRHLRVGTFQTPGVG